MAPVDAGFIQPLGDIRVPLTLERRSKNLPYHLGLLGHDLWLQPVQPVAVGHGGWGEDPLLHPLALVLRAKRDMDLTSIRSIFPA